MFNKKDVLKTKNLTLKSLEDSDKKEAISIMENPLVCKTYMSPVFADEQAKEKFFLKLKEMSHRSDVFLYGIYLNKSLIGFINEVQVENDTIELGYCLHPNEWSKGYATEALKEAIRELFRMGYKTVMASHFIDNIASGKVMQKCGMSKIDKIETIIYRGIEHQCVYYAINK